MNRKGHENTQLFVGNEVELTPAIGCKTLFVVGIQPIEDIIAAASKHRCEQIYFGANHSFAPTTNDEYPQWEKMIHYFLRHTDYWVALDFDVKYAEQVLECGFAESHKFIPMISVKLPYINQLGYNAVLKLDDKDFCATNPGVWCHSLHELQSNSAITRWNEYDKDKEV